MSIKSRIATLERRFHSPDKPCPNHVTTVLIRPGDPDPEESEIPPCPNCGRPGTVMQLIHEIIKPGDPIHPPRKVEPSTA